MTSRPIRFFHRGAIVEVGDAAPTRTVLEWLREDARCTGTKEGCNEGDCGACTTVIGELAAPGDRRRGARPAPAHRQRLHPVPADARRQGAVHGRGPEGDPRRQRGAGGRLDAGRAPHAAAAPHARTARRTARRRPPRSTTCTRCSSAMVECHGSQCGFCTPGFVMSMWSAYERSNACRPRPTRQQLADELSGNLCRCTGYRPILDAGERMFELPPVALDTAPVIAALQTLQADPDAAVRGRRRAASTRRARSTRWPPLRARAAAGDACSRARPTSASGSPSMFRELADLIYVGEVAELKRIERARRRAAHRRRRLARRRVPRAGARVADARGGLAALRVGADPQCRHDGRQRRERLADRRQRAGADGARRGDRAAPRRARCARCRSPTSTSTT